MKSIKRSLSLGLFSVLFLLVGAFGALLYLHARRVLLGQFDAQLKDKASDFAATSEVSGKGEYEFELSKVALPKFEPSSTAEYYQVWGENGAVLLRSPSLEGRDLPRFSADDTKFLFRDISLPDGRAGRAVVIEYLPRVEEDERKNAPLASVAGRRLSLVMARSRVELDNILRALLLFIVLLGFGLPSLAGILVRRLILRGLRPLDRVAEQAASIDADGLWQRFPGTELPRELMPICVKLNEMFERLEASFARERRFVDSAAHELRTPIAELRSLAEVALRYADDPELRETFQDALDIAVQMGRLTDALLALARGESGRQPVELSSVDLSGLIEESWLRFNEQARQKEQSVEIEIAPDLVIESDRTLLAAILDNVFSNALTHAPRAGRIRIEAAREGDNIRLTVGNNSRHLLPEDLERLFEPFWRKDAARTDGRHSGLGLYLVQLYARLLEIELAVELPETDWFRLTLRHPAAGPV